MAEAVPQWCPRLGHRRDSIECIAAPILYRSIVKFRQAPESTPDACLGPTLEVYALIVIRNEHGCLPQRFLLLRLSARIPGNACRRIRLAVFVHRTPTAGRTAACAERGAQVHDGLRIRCGSCVRRAACSDLPQPRGYRRLSGPPADRLMTGKHSLYVTVQDGVPLIQRQRKNRPCR